MDDEGLYAAGLLYELSTKHNSSNLEAPFFHKEIALRTVVGVTCSLSLIGALIIILSYCLDKEIRTKSRQILVHLSVADFGVALANLIGVTVYFDQYIRGCTTDWDDLKPSKSALPANETRLSSDAYSSSSPVSCGALYRLCEAQAFMAGYSTLASVMWTQILAVYVYCLVVLPQNWKWFKVFFMYFAYIFCWGMPFVISLWLVLTQRLGYSPHSGEGWCSLRIYDDTHRLNVLVVVLANDLWIYLTFFTVSVLYLSIRCIKVQYNNYSALLPERSMSNVNKVDTKFLLIPICFLLLRIWTQLLLILFVYAKLKLPTGFIRFLIYAAGIGDSGQGIVNGFLFCILTPKVRQKLFSFLSSILCCLWLYHNCCKERLRLCCPTKDGYSTIHSMASVDLQGSSSTSFPILKQSKRYSSCTVSVTSASSNEELSHAMCQ